MYDFMLKSIPSTSSHGGVAFSESTEPRTEIDVSWLPFSWDFDEFHDLWLL